VSGVGDDANPCSRTAPFTTFAGAFLKTAIRGEINVLDPGDFGVLTITHSISIISDSIGAGVQASGTDGFLVTLANATDKVLIEGIDFEGLGSSITTAGVNGINITGVGKTTIRKCSIRNFSINGVNIAGGANARAVIEDTVILNNGGGVNLQGNAPGIVNTAFLKNSLVDNNTSFATSTTGPSTLVLIGSKLIGSPSSILVTGGGNVISYGNNVLRNGGAPTQTVPLE
jgi:hypothetical protein